MLLDHGKALGENKKLRKHLSNNSVSYIVKPC